MSPDSVDRSLSIVIPTVNRLDLLKRCVKACRQVELDKEIIVVNDGSSDGTRPYLERQPDIRSIHTPRPSGACRAFNLGFKAAKKTHLCWLNDDAYPLPGSLEAALDFLNAPGNERVGLVAMHHTWGVKRNWAGRVERDGYCFGVFHVRGTLYANFGLGRRSLFEDLGYFDESYVMFGYDPDLSLKVWSGGKYVKACPQALIMHDELHDVRKINDLPQGRRDNELLFSRWPLPPINPHRNDYDPRRPCSLPGWKP